MILLLSESKRYLTYFERVAGISLTKSIEETPYGSVEIAKNDNIIFVENMGLAPMGVAYILEKYKVDAMGMVSKVGGINTLLDVGDVLLVDDYIDNTTCRPKSYVEQTRKGIKIRYDMGTPFCKEWRQRVWNHLKTNEIKQKVNVFRYGTYVCTDGPGFESDAEIKTFRGWGADLVGHWISPFVYYARELNICFISIAVVSNVYDKDTNDMLDNDENNELFGKLYQLIVETQPDVTCDCQSSHIIQYEHY